MKHNFSQVDLPVEMLAWRDVTEDILNLYRQSCRLKACIFALCTEGTITASINLMEHEIKKNDLIILMPGTILQLNEQKEKVRLCFVGFSSHCVNGINLLQATMGSFSKIWDNPIVSVSDLIASYFVDYFALLTRISLSHPTATSTAMAQSVLHSILLGINALYANRPQSILAKSRKEEICQKFVQLVIENYMTERRAQFYADKLGISLQHLSTTVKQVTGRNVLEIISHVVITDVKARLKSTDMTIQEIAYSLNFPSASFFGKYFKRHMGMSPLEYRNS